jgi:hypothetical protein
MNPALVTKCSNKPEAQPSWLSPVTTGCCMEKECEWGVGGQQGGLTAKTQEAPQDLLDPSLQNPDWAKHELVPSPHPPPQLLPGPFIMEKQALPCGPQARLSWPPLLFF